MASDVVSKKLDDAYDALAAARTNARTAFKLWVTERGRDYVVLPERTPFNDWRAVNQFRPLMIADLLNGQEVEWEENPLQLAPVTEGGAFISEDEYSTAMELIKWAYRN